MKGIAHFAAGVAVASCFPEAVRAGAAGSPLYFILGGIFGLLPDTIDFKFYRFLYPHDIEVTPDPNKPDPQMIADAVALAVNRAHETGKPVKIKLDTIRLGADLWQQYEVKFDVPARKVIVSYGPVVDTGRTPQSGAPASTSSLGNDSAIENRKSKIENRFEAYAPLLCNIRLDYKATTKIDIFDGPLFKMVPTEDEKVIPHFIPWHRKWSHSFVTALLFSLVGALIWAPLAGMVIFGAYGMHILLDQLGFMGSNLFFPFCSRRTGGLKWVHSEEALPNFTAVWLSCLLIFWTLYRALPLSEGSFGGIHHFNIIKLVFYCVIIPAGIFLLMRRRILAPKP